MEVKISICMCGFAVDVNQKFSVIARDEGVKKKKIMQIFRYISISFAFILHMFFIC